MLFFITTIFLDKEVCCRGKNGDDSSYKQGLSPIFALLVSCYMVTNFTAKTLLVGTVIAILAAAAYFFIKKDRSYEEKHVKWLDDLRLKDEKEGLLDNQKNNF